MVVQVYVFGGGIGIDGAEDYALILMLVPGQEFYTQIFFIIVYSVQH